VRMQTGPAAGQSMQRWLVWTGCLELFNAGLFSFLMWYFARDNPGVVGYFSVVGLVTLNAILVEGGVYWLLKRARFFDNVPARRVLALLRGLYVFDVFLLLAFPASVLVALLTGSPPPRTYDLLIGLVCYLFGVGEFLHYFAFKINMRPRELKRLLKERKPAPARLLRELRQARLKTARDRG
jgi:hypothetical protein